MATEHAENGGSTVLPASDVVQETSSAVVSDPSSQPQQQQQPSSVPETTTVSKAAPTTNPVVTTAADKRWPGWPGDSVFRLIVPVAKVGSIIGRKGELIKKMCDETRARIRVLEGAIGTTDRIVLISGREEPEAQISPAMDAVIRVFKRVTGLSDTEGEGDGAGSVSSVATCSIRLLVAASQAINLIGKQGSLIKSIQEGTGATVRVISGADELPLYATSGERVVDIQGESSKVLKALLAVVGHLRKFLVDHSVVPLFEKIGSAAPPQDRAVENWVEKSQPMHHNAPQTGIGSDYPPFKRESLYLDREMEPQMPHAGLSLYGQDPALAGLRPAGISRSAAPIVTQITTTMQIPLSYAEDIIGIGGANIGYIRRTSGAILTVQESRGLPDEITVEIKGTTSQVQTAQQLIQEFMAGHKDPVASSYGNLDTGLRSYSQLGNSSYPSSSLSSQSLGGYGSSGVGGGYSSYRL